MTSTTLALESGGACYTSSGMFTGSAHTYIYKANVEGYDKVVISSCVYDNDLRITFFSSDSVFDESTMLTHCAPSASRAYCSDTLVVPADAKVVCFGWHIEFNTAKSAVGLKYESD